MAIKNQVVTPHGFTVADAYHRVEDATIIGKTKSSNLLRTADHA